MNTNSLVVVGVGITFVSHLTTEVISHINKASKVLYLINEPAIEAWLKKESVNAESLDNIYFSHNSREKSYIEIANYIIEQLRLTEHLCVVIYGHPTIFAEPGLRAVKMAKELGYHAKILPGISAEDCLFADLLINPGDCGWQSFESTDFLVFARKFDVASHLLLWQIGVINEKGHPNEINRAGLKTLVNYLLNFYPSSHQVILYESSQYPHMPSKIKPETLFSLPTADISRITTLYVPPLEKRELNQSMLELLEDNFQ